MGVIWGGPAGNERYHGRHAFVVTRGLAAFIRSAFAVWRRGY
jgi:hypothetical protein